MSNISRANVGLVKYTANGVGVVNANPGNTTENLLATAMLINGGIMGPNGVIEINHLWSQTNSGNNKTPRIRLGGIGGTIFSSTVLTTSASFHCLTVISNRGSVSSQVAHATAAGSPVGSTAGTPTTGTVDTSVDQDLVFTAQLATGTETLSLERYTVKIWRS